MKLSKTLILSANLLAICGASAMTASESEPNAILLQNKTAYDLKLVSVSNNNVTFGDKSLQNIQMLPQHDPKGKKAAIYYGPDKGNGTLHLEYSLIGSNIYCEIDLSINSQNIQSAKIYPKTGYTCNAESINVGKGYNFIIN